MSPVLPKDLVARIKEETDITAVVREYVTLRAAGTNFVGLCPFHREKTPSFNVNPHRQIYKCFGCGEGGDVISFLMKLQGLSFPEALEVLARPLDVDLARFLVDNDEAEGERQAFFRAQEAAAELWSGAYWGREGAEARAYLEGRGFGQEILKRYDVGFAPAATAWLVEALGRRGVDRDLARRTGLLRDGQGAEPFAYFRNRIIFPVRNIAQRIAGFGGRILGEGEPKYLNSAEGPYFSKRELLYGFSMSRIPIARHKTAILVEGYLDQIALAQAGFGNGVATCGTAFTQEQARILRRGCSRVFVLFDGDAAGIKASVKAAAAALAGGLEPRIGRLPPGEDPASFLLGRDATALTAVLEAAPGYLQLLRDLAAESGRGREARERAVKRAIEAVAAVPDPIRRSLLVDEAAEVFGLARDLVGDEVARRAEPQRPATPAEGRSRPEGPQVARPLQPDRGPLRVDAAAVEQQMLAHALADETGEAAETMLELWPEADFVLEPARRLHEEIAAWLDQRRRESAPPPARFVQERWHAQDDGYRRLVTDLLTDREAGGTGDHARIVRDCRHRLDTDRQRRRLSDALRARPGGRGE
ncbi:MAG: DNA primase [bacterium]|nr:DNA primase [bacterium]